MYYQIMPVPLNCMNLSGFRCAANCISASSKRYSDKSKAQTSFRPYRYITGLLCKNKSGVYLFGGICRSRWRCTFRIGITQLLRSNIMFFHRSLLTIEANLRNMFVVPRLFYGTARYIIMPFDMETV